MGEKERATKTMKLSEVKNALSGIIDEVQRGSTRVLIEKSGLPVAAIISAADLERFARYEQTRAERFKVIEEIREAFKDVPDEEVERETDRIVARIRAENRQRALQAAASR